MKKSLASDVTLFYFILLSYSLLSKKHKKLMCYRVHVYIA